MTPVEDTDYTMEQLTEEFGEEVAYLVDGVTKLDKMTYGENASIETIRKLVLSMSKASACCSSSLPTACTTPAPGVLCRRLLPRRRQKRP